MGLELCNCKKIERVVGRVFFSTLSKMTSYNTLQEVAGRLSAILADLQEDGTALHEEVHRAHTTANGMLDAFCTKRISLRRKLTELHKSLQSARTNGWMPTPVLPRLMSNTRDEEVIAAIEAYSAAALAGASPSRLEMMRTKLLAVYAAMRNINGYLQQGWEEPSLEETRLLLRELFRAVLDCKGVLGKAAYGMEKLWFVLNACVADDELMDTMAVGDLEQMMEMVGAMEEVLARERVVREVG